MGFMGASASFTRFRIVDDVPQDLWPNIVRKLQANAFRDIDASVDERSFGWANFDDMLDSTWQAAPPQRANYLVFSLRLDTRRVPPAVLKKHLTLALREESARNAEQNRTFISRERKRELKEQVVLRLRQRFLPIPAEFNVVWDTDKGHVWLATTNGKIIDMFSELFTVTFDLQLERLTPYTLAQSLLESAQAERLDTIEPTQFAAE